MLGLLGMLVVALQLAHMTVHSSKACPQWQSSRSNAGLLLSWGFRGVLLRPLFMACSFGISGRIVLSAISSSSWWDIDPGQHRAQQHHEGIGTLQLLVCQLPPPCIIPRHAQHSRLSYPLALPMQLRNAIQKSLQHREGIGTSQLLFCQLPLPCIMPRNLSILDCYTMSPCLSSCQK